jgi:molecular chaperone GrpE (heat shock protein)
VNAEDLTEEFELPAGAAEAIRTAVHAEFDEVLPYVLEALRRNNAFDEINERLRAAERRIEARQERPVIIGVHRVLDRMRHLEFDDAIKQALADDIAGVLTRAGYEETGCVGEDYDPARHDAIDGRAVDGKAVVTTVHTHGLASFSDVVVRAKVEISPGPSAL